MVLQRQINILFGHCEYHHQKDSEILNTQSKQSEISRKDSRKHSTGRQHKSEKSTCIVWQKYTSLFSNSKRMNNVDAHQSRGRKNTKTRKTRSSFAMVYGSCTQIVWTFMCHLPCCSSTDPISTQHFSESESWTLTEMRLTCRSIDFPWPFYTLFL